MFVCIIIFTDLPASVIFFLPETEFTREKGNNVLNLKKYAGLSVLLMFCIVNNNNLSLLFIVKSIIFFTLFKDNVLK